MRGTARLVTWAGWLLLGVVLGSAWRPAPTAAPGVPAGALPGTAKSGAASSLTSAGRESRDGAKGNGTGLSRGAGIRFASYNLKNYLPMIPHPDGVGVERAAKPEAERAVVVDSIAELAPDLLGVCEIGGLPEVEDLRGRLRERGLEYPHVEWVDGADEERHLALLSCFPIAERRSQTGLTYLLGDKEYAMQRGILDATVSVNPGYHLRCVGVHLKSKREGPEGDQEWMRRNEALLLRRYVDGILSGTPETNLLVYGDFNDTCNEPALRGVQGTPGAPGYLASIPLEDDRGQAWTHHWDAADIYSRIDYVFYSRALAPEIDHGRCFLLARDDWENGSDHRMAVASIIPVERRR